jgi:hypothetical protein
MVAERKRERKRERERERQRERETCWPRSLLVSARARRRCKALHDTQSLLATLLLALGQTGQGQSQG